MNLGKKIILLLLILTISPLVSANANVAYVVKSSTNLNIETSLNELGYSYDVITDNMIPITDFSKYNLLLIQDNVVNKNQLPVSSMHAIFLPKEMVGVIWPDASYSISSIFSSKFEQMGTDFTDGFTDLNFNAYTTTRGIYYLRVKPSYINRVALTTGASGVYGIVTYSDKNSVRDVSFGFYDAGYWTEDSRKLFKNSLKWLVNNLCTDSDGDYYVDGNVDISVCQKICGPNHNDTCIGNNDCNDTDPNVNPGSTNVFKNCVDDAPIVSNINRIKVSENQNATVIINAIDPEADPMTYSINDPRFVQDSANKNTFRWQTHIGDIGNYTFKAIVSEQNFTTKMDFNVEVDPKNKAPYCDNIPALNWNEDGNVNLNLNDYCHDPENGALNFSVYDESSNNINVDIQNGIVTFSSTSNWFGTGQVSFQVTDGIDQNITNHIILNVNAVNDPPVFSGNIDDVSFNDSTNLTNAFNLYDYFSDIDSNLTFTVSGNNNVNVVINNGVVSFYPPKDWYGSEQIIFLASDGQYTASSNTVGINVLNNDKPPVFATLNCSTDILENANYTCELNGSDFENDTISFSATSGDNLNCMVNGTTLTYSPEPYYYGSASCNLRISDRRGYSDSLFSVQVEHVNQPPTIVDYFPKNFAKLLNDTNQRFMVVASDIDSIISINWLVNDASVGQGNSYTFNGSIGDYNITAIVNDGEFNVSKSWNVAVRPMSDFTCGEARGYICGANEICLGNLLGVKDSNACCAIICSEKPPEFSSVRKCDNKTDNIQINLIRPTSSDELKFGDNVTSEIQISNSNNRKINFDAEIYLYDGNKEKVIQKYKEYLTLNSYESRTIDTGIFIPDDLKETDSYYLFVRTIEKSNESYCNTKYIKLKISRNNYNFVFDNLELIPTTATCGDNVDLNLKIKNTGNYLDRGYIRVENSQLRIDEQSEYFDLDRDKSTTRTFSLKIPDNAKDGEYNIRVSAVFDNFNLVEEGKLVLEKCVEEKADQQELETIKINVKPSKASESSGKTWNLFFVLEGLLVLFVIVIISIMIVFKRSLRNNNPNQKNFPKNRHRRLKSKV